MNWTSVWCAALGGALGGGLGAFVTALIKWRFPDRKNLSILAIVPGIAFAEVGSEVGRSQEFRDWLNPPSRMDLAMRKGTKEMEADPAVVARFKGKNADEARQAGSELSHAGLKRLPSEDLVRWNDIRLVLSEHSKSICAGLWTGKLVPADLMTELGKLPDKELDDWMTNSFKAMRLEAANAPIPPLKPNALAVGIQQVSARLSAPDQTRFQSAIAQGTSLNDDDACWVMKTLMTTMTKLDKPDRDSMTRALASL